EDVVPFWIRHALDADGGINTCIADDGALISRDRWGWSQWRALWVFSTLARCIERRPEWLRIARGLFDSLTARGPLPGGHWPLLVDGEGRVRRGYESISVDGFAIYGAVALWRATGDPRPLAVALETFAATEAALGSEEPLPTFPYPAPPGRMAHGTS